MRTTRLFSDVLSPSDRFILVEVIRHVQTTHPSPLSQPDLSQPIVWDGTRYKRVSPRTCSKSVKPFLRFVDRDFRDTSARTQFCITGVYLVTPNDTTLEPTYFNPDGTFKKYKARLVARGDMLKSKSTDTYSGTDSSQATRFSLGIIAEHDLDLRSFDVKTAFLYTRLNEVSEGIYIRRPKGFSGTEMPAIVRLLLGGLYGLDIASKLFEDFSNTLTTMGFKRLISDPEVFRLDKDGDFCLLSTFGDDAW